MLLLSAALIAAISWNNPQSVVDAAVAASPAVRIAQAEVDAARARERGAGTLPNPMLVSGIRDQQIDLSRDPMMTMYMVGASQTFIRGERRQSLRRAADLEVQQRERELESRKAEIGRDVLIAWTEAAAAQNQIAANEDIVKLAGTIADAARIRYETGSAAQAEIIRAKLEESNVRHDVLTERSARNQALARLRALLNLSPDVAVPAFSLQHELTRRDQQSDVSLNPDTPAVTALEAELAKAEEDIRLAKLTRKPDFDLEASYGFRPQQKDMFSVTGRIELPLRKKTIEPRIAEAIARRDAARARIEQLQQQLRSELGVAIAQRNEAIDQINLHVEQLVPEAKLAFESALASYQTGKSTFESVLGALQSYRMLNVDYYSFLRQLALADAEIDAVRRGAVMRGER